MIDTRGKAYREIFGYLTRGTDTWVVPGLKILSAVFSVTDPTNLTPGGGHFDYELVVTNEGGAPFVLPQTLDWKEIDEEQASQNFVQAELYASMACLNNYSAVLDHLVLYGSDERPGTEIVLNPGDSARILGSGLMPLHLSMSCQKGTATFLASFQVYAMTLHRSPKPTMREGYSLEEEMFAVAHGKKEYPITDSH